MALNAQFRVFSGVSASREAPSTDRPGYAAVRLGDLTTGRVPPCGELRRGSFARDADALPRTRVGDVLVGARGHTFSAAVIGEESAGAVVTENVLVIRHHVGGSSKRPAEPSDTALRDSLDRAPLVPGYLALLLESGAALSLSRATTSGLHLLSPRDLESWEVPMPPRGVQEAAARFREETLRAIDAADHANAARRTLLAHIAHVLESGDALDPGELK